jgi:hypothetical protein
MSQTPITVTYSLETVLIPLEGKIDFVFSLCPLWFLLLIASFFQKKLYSRIQLIDKTQESR